MVPYRAPNDTSGLGALAAPAAAERSLVRGSIGSGEGIVRPKPWLDKRDYEAQLRHHIGEQPDGTPYGYTMGGGSSNQLSVLTWNAGNLDRSGVTKGGYTGDYDFSFSVW